MFRHDRLHGQVTRPVASRARPVSLALMHGLITHTNSHRNVAFQSHKQIRLWVVYHRSRAHMHEQRVSEQGKHSAAASYRVLSKHHVPLYKTRY